MATEHWLTVGEVAKRVGVNEDTVRRWLRAGQLEGKPLGGRAGWRIKETDLQRFMERRNDKEA